MIVDSFIVEVSPQADGRCYIREHHMHEDGSIEERQYLDGIDPSEEDLQAFLDKHAQEINERMAVITEEEVIPEDYGNL